MNDPGRIEDPWDAVPRDGCEEVELAPGATMPLHGTPTAWLVAQGTMDLYAELVAGSGGPGDVAPDGAAPEARPAVLPVLRRQHLLTLEAGEAVFAFPAGRARRAGVVDDSVRVVAAGRGATVLLRYEGSALRQLTLAGGAAGPGARETLIAAIDVWLTSLSLTLGRLAPVIDYVDEMLRPGTRIDLESERRVVAYRGIVWAKLSNATVRFLDTVNFEAGSEPRLLPLCPRTWLTAGSALTLETATTAEIAEKAGFWSAMERFHQLSLELLQGHLGAAHAREEERLASKASLMARDRGAVLERFRAVFDRGAGRGGLQAGGSALVEACRRIGEDLDVEIEAPAEVAGTGGSTAARIEEIAARSRLRTRRVVLRHAWWRQESGPMLGFRRDDHAPVALLTAGRGRVPQWAPEAEAPSPVTATAAAAIDPVAYSFYRTLPDRPLGPVDLIKFAAAVCRSDLLTALLFSAAGALTAMLVPIATGLIIDVSIPGHQPRQLAAIAICLVVAAIAGYCFNVCENIAILRVKGNVKRALEPAVLDRLLRMPSNFFRRYAAGDLAQRTMTIALLQSKLTAGALSSLLAGVFSLSSFAIMIYLQPAAALVAMLVLAVLAAASLWAVYRQQAALASTQELRGRLASMVLQMVTGIQRVRLAGAESRFFVRWGHLFMELREAFFQAYRVRVAFTAFSSGYQIFGFAVVFGALAFFAGGTLSTGGFLAFIAAFGITMTGFAQMSKTLVDLADLAPMYRRVQPLLENRPEGELKRAHPGVLAGRIELNEVFFRYGTGTPMILQGVSLVIEPGESAAIVGASGCGKSTLLRLILGFEQPMAGSIYFDGKDLASLDPREVRRQLGVVLQNDKLMEASLYENIGGVNDISVEDAWTAARMSGIAADIEAMPLGMHTVISAEGSDLSGGQAQRLLIARALAARPRILLLDEATSALDNKAQATVVESLERLRVTRIAVAHRLSTVKRADKIFVLDQGRVAESGSYEELMTRGGLFAELVYRQLQ